MLKSVLFCLLFLFSCVRAPTTSSDDASPTTTNDEQEFTLQDWFQAVVKFKECFPSAEATEIQDEAKEIFLDFAPKAPKSKINGKFEDVNLREINDKLTRLENLEQKEIGNLLFACLGNELELFMFFFQPAIKIPSWNAEKKGKFLEEFFNEKCETLEQVKSRWMKFHHTIYSMMDRSRYPKNVLAAFEVIYGEPLEEEEENDSSIQYGNGISPLKNHKKWPLWFTISVACLFGIFTFEIGLGIILGIRFQRNSIPKSNGY